MNNQIGKRLMEILLVDDNPGDLRLAAEALKEGDAQVRLHTVQDGMEAMAFLRRTGEYMDVPRPDLILLDLNMPRMNGRQVLAEIKEDSTLKYIPVVVLTGSRELEDMVKTYDLHANSYVTKPTDFEQFIVMLNSITSFWLSVLGYEWRGVN